MLKQDRKHWSSGEALRGADGRVRETTIGY
jgi:hypothetical protein